MPQLHELRGGGRRRPVFWGLLLLTALYFGALVVLTGQTKGCLPEGGWLAEHVSCLSLNELGDALAGIFAPVAFIWLAGAVLIQSQELDAQREEMVSTREVMRAQVEEASASAAQLRTQTSILSEQNENARRALSDAVFDAIIENHRNFQAGINWVDRRSPEGEKGRCLLVLSPTVVPAIPVIENQLSQLEACLGEGMAITNHGRSQIDGVREAIRFYQQLSMRAATGSEAYQARASKMEVTERTALLERVVAVSDRIPFEQLP